VEERSALVEVPFVTAVVVLRVPVHQTDKAELMPAEAAHVIAAFGLLDEHVAGWTALPFLEVALEVDIAWSLVALQHALLAEGCVTGGAGIGDCGINDAFAVLGWTKSEIGVADGLFPQQELPVFAFVVLRNVLEALIIRVQLHLAVLLGTVDCLHD
jgi:hypothetical protein